eukprot:SAG22_NODE_1787_length_3579_cov_2.621264_1_plen_688_part_00
MMTLLSPPMRSILHLLFAPALLAAAAASEPTAALWWAGHPVRQNETLMLQGYGTAAAAAPAVELRVWDESKKAWSSSPVPAPRLGSSASGISAVLPESAKTEQHTAYRASIGGGRPVHVNTPEVWWLLGDAGNASTNAGAGWVRAFGRSIHLLAADPAAGAQLTLTSSGGAVPPVTLKMEPGFAHNGAYNARFKIPTGIAPGLYDVSVSNALAPSYFEPMAAFFETPSNPRRAGQLRIVPPPRAKWPQLVHTAECIQLVDRPAPDSSRCIQAALEKAWASGGGVVYLPPGVYSFTGGIVLPANTILKGAGADKTWLTLTAQNMSEAPQHGYFTSNQTGGWGVEDLTVYTSSAGYYYSIFNMQKFHSGVTIRRVTLRANPFHSQVEFCKSGRTHPPEVCNFTWFGGRSPAVRIDGVSSFEVSDCDLYSAWISIGNGHYDTNASYGMVARNKLWSGNAAHWFNQVHQVVYEDNEWVGVAMQAYGSNIDTYNGGFSQNLYLSGNSYRFSYGGDREMLTLDTLNAYYFGPVAVSSPPTGAGPPTVTLAPCSSTNGSTAGGGEGQQEDDMAAEGGPMVGGAPVVPCRMTNSGQAVAGGAVAVMNGTGSGQVRRIVSWPNVSHNPIITLDAAFDPPLDGSSFVTVSPYVSRLHVQHPCPVSVCARKPANRQPDSRPPAAFLMTNTSCMKPCDN